MVQWAMGAMGIVMQWCDAAMGWAMGGAMVQRYNGAMGDCKVVTKKYCNVKHGNAKQKGR